MRLTIGGEQVNYLGDCGTPTIYLLNVKILINSFISSPNANFITIDIKDFYLNTPMAQSEYMRLTLSDLPENVISHYNLEEKVTTNGLVYVEIKQGMSGLPHSDLIPQHLLEKRINKQGYKQSALTPGLWTHAWRPITFSLCVDNFGAKYVGKQHDDHLNAVICKHYKISNDWSSKRYLGLDLDWDYKNRKVHLSMLTYVTSSLKRFNHTQPCKPQHQPYPHIKPIYSATSQ